jgi:hypothetical protein
VADWATISALATGAGTLALAVATFASVRSSNRSARLAEQALQEQRRPVLVHSRRTMASRRSPSGRPRATVPGERTISSFGVLTGDDGGWIAAVGRHWYLDGIAPR